MICRQTSFPRRWPDQARLDIESAQRRDDPKSYRFLTSEELARLGDVLREAETIGLPYDVDETKPTAKHAPKRENRRRKMDPRILGGYAISMFGFDFRQGTRTEALTQGMAMLAILFDGKV